MCQSQATCWVQQGSVILCMNLVSNTELKAEGAKGKEEAELKQGTCASFMKCCCCGLCCQQKCLCSFGAYLKKLLSTIYSNAQHNDNDDLPEDVHLVNIPIMDTGAAEFDLSDKQVQALSQSGYYAMQKYFNGNIGRRYSIGRNSWVQEEPTPVSAIRKGPGLVL